MAFRVSKVSPEIRPDFWRVHCDERETGWCCCVAWWVPTWDGWGERTADENRRFRDDLFDRGEYDGYLLYADDQPVAWCQAGPRDRLEKLRLKYGLEPAPDTWAISCFVVAPEFRGLGAAHALLAGVLEDLAAQGVRRVEAFPAAGEGLPADDVWTGPARLYAKHGFSRSGGSDDRPVLARSLGMGGAGSSIPSGRA